MSDEAKFDAEKVRRLFSSPIHIPADFKTWMIDQMVLNVPDLPVGQAFRGRNLARQLMHNVTAVTATATSETQVFSFTVPKNVMAKNGRIVIDQHLTVSCNDVSNTCSTKLYFGGVAVCEVPFSTAFLDGNVRNCSIRWVIQARDSYSSQLDYAFFWLEESTSYAGTGSGSIGLVSAVDTTADQTVACKVAWGSGGSQSYTHRHATATLFNPVSLS